MTTGRALSLATSRTVDLIATWSPADLFRRLGALLWPESLTVVQRLVRLFWLPFWFGTDLPAPNFADSRQALVPETDAARRFGALLAATRRKQLINRAAIVLVRIVALVLLAGLTRSVLALNGADPVDREFIRTVALVVTVPGLIFAWRYRPSLRETAAMLDRSFDLQDRLTTAFDHAASAPGARRRTPNLAYLHVVEATNTLAILSRHVILRLRAPIREIVLASGLAMLFLALHLLNGTGTAIEPVGEARVPVFVPASERLKQQSPAPPEDVYPELYKPTVAEVQEMADQSAAAQQDLAQIADALDDNPLTSPVADAIREGDYDRAAAELEAIAPSLSTMAPELREELADNLDAAADAMTGENPELQEAASDAADGLRSDPETAQESIEDLSGEIADTGSKVADQQELAEQMREARENDTTGSVEDSSDSRPGEGSNDEGAESTDQSTAGEGSDAAGGEQAADSDTSAAGSENAGSESGSGQQPGEGGESESGSGATDNPLGSEGSSASGESAGGERDPGDSSQQGGGSATGDSSRPDGNSEGNSDTPQTGAGTGAGGGEGDNSEPNTSNSAESRPGTGGDDSPDPNVIDGPEGDGSGSSGVESDPGGGESIELSQAPNATGEKTGGSSSSSTGSGAGVAAGAGSVEQGDVGAAGPDANRVPSEYRPIVEDYFSDTP